MSTTRLPKDLKSRMTVAAERAGTTPHNFTLEASSQRVGQQARRSDFNTLADTRYAEIVATGKTLFWNEMRGPLEGRLAGKTATRPVVRKVTR